MKCFCIIANPEYFKKNMGWDMEHHEVKYTDDKLVMFVANKYVPETNPIEPYGCWLVDTEVPLKALNSPYEAIISELNLKETENEK